MCSQDTVVHSERAHSKLSASSAARWMACPGSIALIEQCPEQSTSKFAQEGTCAHELVEKALLEGAPCRAFVGKTLENWVVTEEMAEYCQIYVDYVERHGKDKEVTLEERFDLSFVEKGMFGTNDACISEPYGTLEIIDLKYGMGVVEAKDNKQLLYYALGASNGAEYATVKLTIIQPRVYPPVKSWEIPFSQLEEFEKTLKSAVEETKKESAATVTGSHCKYCPAKAICPQMKLEASKALEVAFDVPVEKAELPHPSKLSPEKMMVILKSKQLISDWLKSVDEYARQEMLNGVDIPDFKLVRANTKRKYVKDTSKLLATLIDNGYEEKMYDKKLISFGKLEKLVGKAMVEPFITKPEGALTVVPLSDKRAGYDPNPFTFPKDLPTEESDKFKQEAISSFEF